MTDLHHYIEIDATPNEVFDAVATEEGLKSWWTEDAKATDEKGGRLEFGFLNRAVVFRMTLAEMNRPERIVWSCEGDHPEWAGTRLEWNVGKGENGTALTLHHRGWKEATSFCASCNSTWGELMHRLKDYVESKKPSPHWGEGGRAPA